MTCLIPISGQEKNRTASSRLTEPEFTLCMVDIGARSFRREGVKFAGQGRERGCNLGQPGADVGAGCAHGAGSPVAVVVACVRLCDREAEPALDPAQDCVPYPVGADLLGFHPGQMLAESLP